MIAMENKVKYKSIARRKARKAADKKKGRMAG